MDHDAKTKLPQGLGGGYWQPVKDGNPTLFDMYMRHYSAYKYKDGRRENIYYPNRRLVMGPGYKLCLLGTDYSAIFGWRVFKSDDNQTGINCAFFRNESDHLSSRLILLAEKLAAVKWPDENRYYTYVNPRKIRPTNRPGWCFIKAGYREVGITKSRKLIILAKRF